MAENIHQQADIKSPGQDMGVDKDLEDESENQGATRVSKMP